MKERCTTSLNGSSVEVDTELEPLLQELNKVGIKTIYSCSGRWIKTAHLPEGEKHSDMAYLCLDGKNLSVDVRDGKVFIYWNRYEDVGVLKEDTYSALQQAFAEGCKEE